MAMLPEAATAALQAVFPPDRFRTDLLTRLAYARDASAYRMLPAGVLFPKSLAEIQALFRIANRWHIPLTFRAAGTSLSGQAIGAGLIVDIRRYWTQLSIDNGGATVRAQPGVLAGKVNQQLQPYRRKIGPDPASLNLCTIGGILANNASGMCCGVRHNAYHTLVSMQLLLPDGTFIDSSHPDANALLQQQAPTLYEGLQHIQRQLAQHPKLQQRIRQKYRQKNTTGYSLNALLDYHTPVEIITHLMIGSEGTLGFIAEAELRTLPAKPFTLTALCIFDSITDACAAIPRLQDAEALELMDAACIRSTASLFYSLGFDDSPSEHAAALLVEFAQETETDLRKTTPGIHQRLRNLPGLRWLHIAQNAQERARIWNTRKGLYPIVGGQRPAGTTVIIEDVVFPIEHLDKAVMALRLLFSKYDYHNAIIFGHAKDGNLHFVITPDLGDPTARSRYDRFMQDLARLVLQQFGGALKGEHGTGRNVAPFVEWEWGAALTELMRQLKALFDPGGILNPGVLLSDDPRAHANNLKPFPAVDPAVDRCTECGFCEAICPSRNATLTPRQRIQVLREWHTLPGHTQKLLHRNFQYAVLDTCAADHLCAVACPLDIDTGALVIHHRSRKHRHITVRLTNSAVSHFAALEAAARHGLAIIHKLTTSPLAFVLPLSVRQWAQHIHPLRHLPTVPASATNPEQAEIFIFPSCISRILQGSTAAIPFLLWTILQRQHLPAAMLTDPALCCGLLFDSKGFPEAGKRIRHRSLRTLRQHLSYQNGRFYAPNGKPATVLIDQSSCAAHWQRTMAAYPVEDANIFLAQILPLPTRLRTGAVHLSCGILHHSHHQELIAQLRQHTIPFLAQCCGAAGDRGLFIPELPRSALQGTALPETVDALFTTNLLCAPILCHNLQLPTHHWIEAFALSSP